MKSELEIVVLSYDGFSELWPVFFDFYFKNNTGKSYKINLVTNHKIYEDSRVNSLQVGEDISWSSNLIKSLNKINSERFLFLYDDVFFLDFNNDYLGELLNVAIVNNYDFLTLRPSLFPEKWGKNNLAKIKKDAPYRTPLFLSIVKKEIMLNLLKSDENAWQFEVNGSFRSKDYSFYTTKQEEFNYIHAIVKRSWCYPAYRVINKLGKYDFKVLNKRESITSYAIRVTKERAYFSYYKYLPAFIIYKLDALRLKSKYNK